MKSKPGKAARSPEAKAAAIRKYLLDTWDEREKRRKPASQTEIAQHIRAQAVFPPRREKGQTYAARVEAVFKFFLLWPDRTLAEPFVKAVIAEAAARDDQKFFRKLGRVLESPAIHPDDPAKQDDNIGRKNLIKYWEKPPPLKGFPPLSRMTLRGRVAVLNTLAKQVAKVGNQIVLRAVVTAAAVSAWQNDLQFKAPRKFSELQDAEFLPYEGGARLIEFSRTVPRSSSKL